MGWSVDHVAPRRVLIGGLCVSGFVYASIGVFPENPQIDNSSVGLESLATNPRDAGLSLISIFGYSPLGQEYNNPQASTSNTYQLGDTATWAAPVMGGGSTHALVRFDGVNLAVVGK